MSVSSQEIQSIIQSMSLEAKVGQLFLLAYPGKNPESIRPLIEKYGICVCYISQDNAETFAEAQSVSARLQDMSLARQEKIPLLLGVDQEGAWGVLVPESRTGPGNLALGALKDKKLVSEMYAIFGHEMLQAGYNALLGPCADVNTNPLSPIIGTRSFGEYPQSVAECVKAAIHGTEETGIITTLKHFPGHGSTAGDSHREIPHVDKSLQKLLKEDLLPFQAGIEAGASIIMTAHIRYPQIDPENPATLSSIILQDILRGRLGFQGVILSDSMNMGAIRRYYKPAESTLLALAAGVDIVMLSEEHYDHSGDYLEKQIDSMEGVRKAILNGKLSESLVDEKLMRILRMKLRLQPSPESSAKTEKTNSGYSRTEAVCAEKAFCLLQKNHWGMPREPEAQVLCVNATPVASYANLMNSRGIGPNQAEPAFKIFRKTLSSLQPNTVFLSYEDCTPTDKPGIPGLEKAHTIIIVTEDYPLPGEDFQKDKQQALVISLARKYAEKLIIVGLRSSYELALYPKNVTYLCSYSSRSCAAEAAAKIIHRGETSFSALPPVTARAS